MQELADFKIITLTLDDIVPNEDTLRYSLHPDLDGLKESISIRGLELPLVVTLNPDSAGKYSIYSDGNSRLEALKQLYTETGDIRFFKVDCVLHPWTGRLACVLRDLAAISTQGEKSHLDNSLEIYKAKELYENELGKMASLREFSMFFDKQGILIGKDRISYSLKTIDVIFPAFPTLLEKGMSARECIYLIGICDTIKNAWNKIVGRSGDISYGELHEIFVSVAEHYDGVDLYNRVEFIAQLSLELSKAINLSGITPLVWVNVINDPSLVFYMQAYVPEVDDIVFSDFNDGFDKSDIQVNVTPNVEISTVPVESLMEEKDQSSIVDAMPIVHNVTNNCQSQGNENNVYVFEDLKLKGKIFEKVSLLANRRKPNNKAVRKNSTNISLPGYELVNIPNLIDDPFFKFIAAFTGFGLSINGVEIVSLLIGTHKDEPLLSDDEFDDFIDIIRESRRLKLLQRQSKDVIKKEVVHV